MKKYTVEELVMLMKKEGNYKRLVYRIIKSNPDYTDGRLLTEFKKVMKGYCEYAYNMMGEKGARNAWDNTVAELMNEGYITENEIEDHENCKTYYTYTANI